MKFSSDKKTYTANAIERNLQGGMVAPVSDLSHVPPVGFELRITYKSQWLQGN